MSSTEINLRCQRLKLNKNIISRDISYVTFLIVALSNAAVSQTDFSLGYFFVNCSRPQHEVHFVINLNVGISICSDWAGKIPAIEMMWSTQWHKTHVIAHNNDACLKADHCLKDLKVKAIKLCIYCTNKWKLSGKILWRNYHVT